MTPYSPGDRFLHRTIEKMPADYSTLFYWVREREAIRSRKDAGCRFPWTDDKILQTYRFCNVRREDDRVTVWVADNIRKPFADHQYLWLMLCIARQLNWPDTLGELITTNAWPVDDSFCPMQITDVLSIRKSRGDKVYTGAYMISAPATKGSDKQTYIAETVIGDLWRRRKEFSHWSSATMRGVHERITRSNGWGNFMAYQAVVDMRFTKLLENSADREEWAAAGPGTLRGLNRVYGREVNAASQQRDALREMRSIYQIVEAETGVRLDFSDIPNILCETDKYLRVKNGEGKPRALYVQGRGS